MTDKLVTFTFKPNPKDFKKLIRLYKKAKFFNFLKKIRRKILKILFPKWLIIKYQGYEEGKEVGSKIICLKNCKILSVGNETSTENIIFTDTFPEYKVVISYE